MMLLLCSTSNASENGPDRPQSERLEPKAIVVNSGGASYVCYSPKDGVEVGRIFSDYHALWAYSLLLEKEITSYKREIGWLNKEIVLWKRQSDEFKERGDVYLSSFETEHKLLLESERARYQKDRWAWVPWSLTAAVAVVFGIAYATK